MRGQLVRHGARATRRRWVRALVPACVPAALAVVAVAGRLPWWLLWLLILPVAAALAADRARSLGHALAAGHLVSRSGSCHPSPHCTRGGARHRLELLATWFQRRAGLCTLVATTAGGSQAVPVLDIPEDDAVRLTERALPDLVVQFLAEESWSPRPTFR